MCLLLSNTLVVNAAPSIATDTEITEDTTIVEQDEDSEVSEDELPTEKQADSEDIDEVATISEFSTDSNDHLEGESNNEDSEITVVSNESETLIDDIPTSDKVVNSASDDK